MLVQTCSICSNCHQHQPRETRTVMCDAVYNVISESFWFQLEVYNIGGKILEFS